MAADPKPPHPDALEDALRHFNASFRHRYRLPEVQAETLRRDVADVDARLLDLSLLRLNGIRDASCALIARLVVSIVPRYAIGFLDGHGRVTVELPDEGDDLAYRGHHVVLVNPLGGYDNWASVARWVRRIGGDQARRRELAGRAIEQRPDEAANEALLLTAAETHERAIVLPPDEAFSAAKAAEVSYVYDVPFETLRAWKRRYRREFAAGKPGAPRKEPVKPPPPA